MKILIIINARDDTSMPQNIKLVHGSLDKLPGMEVSKQHVRNNEELVRSNFKSSSCPAEPDAADMPGPA